MRKEGHGSFVGRFALISISAAMLAACVSTTSTVSTEYYAVNGSTSQQLDRELRRKGPLNGHALASAAIRFEPVALAQQESALGCSFKTAKFRVDANITLPRWINKSQSRDRDLRRAWDGLSKYARLHEQTHVKIAETYAKLLGNALIAIPPQRSCERLDRQSKKVVDKIYRSHDKAQQQFDADEQRRLAALFAESERESGS